MSNNAMTKKSYINTETGKKIFYRLSVLFLFVYIVLPQYFGLDTPGFDLTMQRIMFLFVMAYILEDVKKVVDFFSLIKHSELLPFVAIYLFICFYTAIYRHHIGTFLYSFIEILTMYIVIYVVKRVVGVKNTLRLVKIFAFILCVLGILEFLLQKTPFEYLETIDGLYTGGMIRSGSYRVMGPANHSLGYGLILITFIPVACIDLEEDKVDLFANKILLLLLIVNVFLTGSRSTLAVSGLEILLLIIFSDRQNKKKTFLYLFFFILIMTIIVLVFYNTGFSRYIMLQITSVVDEIFGTEISVNFGADRTTLYNSSNYRSFLPQIFGLDFLSPWIGKGSGYAFSWYVDGALIASIDNYYVAMYIRYAYPGMIAYIVFVLKVLFSVGQNILRTKSGMCKVIFIGILCYFINLWWLDTLQTIKYVYFMIAIYYSCFGNEVSGYITEWRNEV